METEKSKLWAFILEGLGLLLLLYTALRTYNFLSWTTRSTAVALLGLAATEGGLYVWTRYHVKSARGAGQRAVSLILIVVCLIGVSIAFVADMLINAESFGLVSAIDPNVALAIIGGVALVTIANVAAYIAVLNLDPEVQREATDEALRSKVENEATAKKKERSAELAKELADAQVAAWESSLRALYASTPPARSRNSEGAGADAPPKAPPMKAK